jgi:plastocyanin
MRRLLLIAALLALAAPGAAENATNPKLIGTVGPGFTISFTTEAGARVTQLDPGTYEITVKDQDSEHNFHLSGPGVDRRTDVEFVGTEQWTFTFAEGRYRFVCDPHDTSMRGDFTVGNPPPEPPPPPPPSPSPGAKPGKLFATVGPGFTIGLRTGAGAAVRSVSAGLYTVSVRDRSAGHNFHLIGPGVNRATKVSFVGTATWSVRLAKGKTYRFRCDPHATRMRGSFKSK